MRQPRRPSLTQAHLDQLVVRCARRRAAAAVVARGHRSRTCAQADLSSRPFTDVESIIIIAKQQDEFVRLSGAKKHPRSVVGASGMDVSAESGAPWRCGDVWEMTRQVGPPLMTTDFTSAITSHNQRTWCTERLPGFGTYMIPPEPTSAGLRTRPESRGSGRRRARAEHLTAGWGSGQV